METREFQRRYDFLTIKQKKLFSIAKSKGYVTLENASMLYNSAWSSRNALQTLTYLKMIRVSIMPNTFDFIRDYTVVNEDMRAIIVLKDRKQKKLL